MAGGKRGCLVIFIIVGVSILLLYPSVQKTRGQLNALREEVTATWSHIDETFQRRVDLIPNLVETVKSYAPHEEDIFGTLTRLQLKVATRMSLPAKIAANNS